MGECCICSAGDGCLAGHGECSFNPATTEQIIQRIVNGKYQRYKETMLTELRRRGKNRITDYKCDSIKCAVCGRTLEINHKDTEWEYNVIESLNTIIRQQAKIVIEQQAKIERLEKGWKADIIETQPQIESLTEKNRGFRSLIEKINLPSDAQIDESSIILNKCLHDSRFRTIYHIRFETED